MKFFEKIMIQFEENACMAFFSITNFIFDILLCLSDRTKRPEIGQYLRNFENAIVYKDKTEKFQRLFFKNHNNVACINILNLY
jgi:hypothetical protein